MTIHRFDFLVIGSGLAGLTYALRVAEHGKVAVITKSAVFEANTLYAQGGIAAAVGEADSWQLHEEDTLTAGGGLCNREAVRFLVREAPRAIEWLESLGTRFDREPLGPHALELGLEGGHSRRRIVHHADRTGWEVGRAVLAAVRANPRIEVFEFGFATELLIQDQKCVGVGVVTDPGGIQTFLGRSTLLATGGCGRLYQHTTNPSVATGDGVALAHRAGAAIENMEFMQFHPTTLYHPQMRSFLLTEALRGAGATLRNHLGRRFMYDYDPRLELAPRDVVSRAIDSEMKRLGTWCVYLDATHLPQQQLREEFPTIYHTLEEVGLEMAKDWVPVVPAQHYSCGGVVTDLDGQTSIQGLFAAGEVACTGVHGANRLASNSLLEALVFAAAAAEKSVSEPAVQRVDALASEPTCMPENESVRIRRQLERIMTEQVGIVRSYAGLERAAEEVASLRSKTRRLHKAPFSSHPAETANLLEIADLVIEGARNRKQNVGVHFNIDAVALPSPNS